MRVCDDDGVVFFHDKTPYKFWNFWSTVSLGLDPLFRERPNQTIMVPAQPSFRLSPQDECVIAP